MKVTGGAVFVKGGDMDGDVLFAATDIALPFVSEDSVRPMI